jgi:hypothetical protein
MTESLTKNVQVFVTKITSTNEVRDALDLVIRTHGPSWLLMRFTNAFENFTSHVGKVEIQIMPMRFALPETQESLELMSRLKAGQVYILALSTITHEAVSFAVNWTEFQNPTVAAALNTLRLDFTTEITVGAEPVADYCRGCSKTFERRLMVCPTCKVNRYCGADCQWTHWNTKHHQQCTLMKTIRDTAKERFATE